MYGAVSIGLLLEAASANGKYMQLMLPFKFDPEYVVPDAYFCDIQTGYACIRSDSLIRNATIQTTEHPGFGRMRTELEKSGHLDVQRQWYNGDRVLKRFKLNKIWFEAGEQFPSAAAMAGHMRSWETRNV